MADKKLTPVQLAVLRAAADGNLYRSESIRSLYKSFRSDTHANVTRQADALADLNLIRIGEQRGAQRPWHIEPDGLKALADYDAQVQQ
ncbi:hypothetical protein [Micromonospora sp. CA-248212]|uniref:hypothetical protein n=1 Tax=Micromonospora sp. CA-248212 TaxID=3239961 RepID=UPI003D920005